jgi:hypothetical protein
MPEERHDNQAYERARKRVQELRDFYSHLGIFLALNLGLFLINMLVTPGRRWFLWPLILWGCAVLFHGMAVFFGGPFGQRWEERKTRQLMERERSRWGPRPPQPGTP